MDFGLGVRMAGPTDPVLLYAHPSMDLLAKQIVEKCGQSQTTGFSLAAPGKRPVSS